MYAMIVSWLQVYYTVKEAFHWTAKNDFMYKLTLTHKFFIAVKSCKLLPEIKLNNIFESKSKENIKRLTIESKQKHVTVINKNTGEYCTNRIGKYEYKITTPKLFPGL